MPIPEGLTSQLETVNASPTTVADLSIPEERHTMAVRFIKSSFCVEIWKKQEAGDSVSRIWALILTSRISDGRMAEVKGVWSLMRRAFEVSSTQGVHQGLTDTMTEHEPPRIIICQLEEKHGSGCEVIA